MRRTRATLIAATAVTTGLAIMSPTSAKTGDPSGDAADRSASPTKSSARERKDFYDARQGTRSQQVARAQKALTSGAAADLQGLRRTIGPDASISIDEATGTPRNVANRDGYLTSASDKSARSIGLRYVKAHLADFGLVRSDLATFRVRQSYRDPLGIAHVSWEQVADGIPVFGNGLKAHVSKRGRLIAVQGSPVSGLVRKAAAATSSPSVSASAARAGAAKDVGGRAAKATTKSGARTTTWSNGDRATQVWFASGSGVRLGWNTVTKAGDQLFYSHVVDATSGRVLYRRDLIDSDRGDASVYDNYPGATKGGTARTVNFLKAGWLDPAASWLKGKNIYTWSDVNDDNIAQGLEKAPVPTGTDKLVPFNTNALCSARFVCTWDPEVEDSWTTNRDADANNAFFLGNRFHDYLTNAPFGFNGANGNFEEADGDPVLLQTLDGADTAGGLPDANHIDNANMGTPPDGTPPTMQMYLWHQPGTTNNEDPFLPTSGAFDASILFHEYTHGLSNRLVVDATGNSTLNSIQAGSMGEAWSDYYAMDYLLTNGFDTNSSADGDVLVGKYVTVGAGIRTQGLDCPVTSTVANCTAIDGKTKGGYTYGDFPTIGGSPEVHSSGELWSQTLWDLRKTLGHTVTASLVTRAMELSPEDPSMLDMRNAILQADKAGYNGAHKPALWTVFANRGMGWFAGSVDAGDSRPAEDFQTPPSAERPRGTLSGTVTDAVSGAPLPGLVVSITGHDSGYIGSFTAVTNASGRYSISNVPAGTYRKVVVSGNGYVPVVKQVSVAAGGAVVNWATRKDYAALSAGGSVTDFTGPDYTDFGCGPDRAIDLSQGTGWGSTTGDDDGTPTATPIPKTLTVKLSEPIDVSTSGSAFAVDPSNTCGDPGSSSTGQYRIEVSTDGTTWQTAVDGTGANAFTAANRFVLNNLASSVAVAGAQYVRFTMISPQVPDIATNCPDGAFGGCTFMDMTELEVFGTPAA